MKYSYRLIYHRAFRYLSPGRLTLSVQRSGVQVSLFYLPGHLFPFSYISETSYRGLRYKEAVSNLAGFPVNLIFVIFAWLGKLLPRRRYGQDRMLYVTILGTHLDYWPQVFLGYLVGNL